MDLNSSETSEVSSNPYSPPIGTVRDVSRFLHPKTALLALLVATATLVISLLLAFAFGGNEAVPTSVRDFAIFGVIAIGSSLPFLFVNARWYWILLLTPVMAIFLLSVAAFIMVDILGV